MSDLLTTDYDPSLTTPHQDHPGDKDQQHHQEKKKKMKLLLQMMMPHHFHHLM
jgi:hypothetical protein